MISERDRLSSVKMHFIDLNQTFFSVKIYKLKSGISYCE